VVHHYGTRPELVVLGGLVPELLCSGSGFRHAGTIDVDVQVDLEIACGSVNTQRLERALRNGVEAHAKLHPRQIARPTRGCRRIAHDRNVEGRMVPRACARGARRSAVLAAGRGGLRGIGHGVGHDRAAKPRAWRERAVIAHPIRPRRGHETAELFKSLLERPA
jgi:hypothetical protein